MGAMEKNRTDQTVDLRGRLLAELAAEGVDRLADVLTAAGVDGPVLVDGRALVDDLSRSLAQAMAYIGFARGNPGLFRLMVGPMAPAQAARLQPAAARAHAQLTAGLGVDPGGDQSPVA